MSEIDTNVDNYSRDELLTILHLPDDASIEQIKGAVARQVSRFRAEGNNLLVVFFTEVQTRLIDDDEDALADEPDDEEVGPWLRQQYLDGEERHLGPTPDRRQMTKNFNHPQYPMKQQQIGVQQIFDVGVAQGQNNPNLVNTLTRTMVIDSKLRDNIFPHFHEVSTAPSSPSQFNITMSNPLKNCISLSLTSVTLPKTWYNVESGLGTNIFWVDEYPIFIPSGFYDPSGLADVITQSANYPTTPLKDVSFDKTTGQFSLNFVNLLPTPVDVSVVFWSRDNRYQALPGDSPPCSSQQVPNTKVDFNLGYFMGFRNFDGVELGETVSLGIAPLNKTTAKAQAVYDLEGTRSVYVLVEDHNQNRLNTQVLNIAQEEKRIIVPDSYAPTDLSYTCLPGVQTPFYLPSSLNPYSGLTQAQIYSINAIAANQSIAKDRVIGPQQSNILGCVPVQSYDVEWGKNIVAVGNQLQTNTRVYFGPVDINRLSIKLIDDVGNVLNLHGRDWTFTTEVKSLYQY